MKVWKKLLGAALALICAFAVSLEAGTWIFAAERDEITRLGPFRLTVSGLGAGLGLLTWLAFAAAWFVIAGREARDRLRAERAAGRAAPEEEDGIPRGRWINALGFGILPATAVWKCFEMKTALGQGAPLPEGWAPEGLLVSAGAFLPGRIELILALVLFASLVLWLALRHGALPENGDLAGVSAALWGSARMVTESLRQAKGPITGGPLLSGWLAAILVGAVLAVWTVRALRQKRNTGYILACIPVYAVSVAGIVLIQNRVVETVYPAVNLGMQALLSLLALKAALCMGRVTRG